MLAATSLLWAGHHDAHALFFCCNWNAPLTRCTLPPPLPPLLLLLLMLLPPQASKCEVECMTVARACAQVSDELDLSDLSEALFKGHKRSALSSEACHESTDVCRKKPPPVPKVGVRALSCASSCTAAACLGWCAIGYLRNWLLRTQQAVLTMSFALAHTA